MNALLLTFLVAVFCQDPFPIMPENPIFRNIYTADPSARVWADGRLYVYPSHDIAPPRGSDLMDGYHVFSTDDMLNWVDHGEILHSRDVAWGRPEGGFMWAPDCVFNNGKYYFYFPHPSPGDWGSQWKIGVAVSTSPTSGFVDMGKPMDGIGGPSMIDPNVFIDDDGRVYFYYGGGSRNENAQGCELNDDMVTMRSRLEQMVGVQDFHEGIWVFKKDGLYYLTYADNYNQGGGNQMRYCVSFSPLGPWTYMGIFLGPCDSGTTHGSVVLFKGQWFLFYQNKALSGMETLRSVCVTKLFFRDDGTIIHQEPERSVVPPPETRPNGGVEYRAQDYATLSGSALWETAPSGERVIAQLQMNGSYSTWRGIGGGATGGKKLLYLRYSSDDDGAFVKLKVNGVEVEPFFARGNNSWNTFNAYTHVEVELNAGDNNVLEMEGGYFGLNILSVIVV